MHGLQQPTRTVSAEAGRSLDRHHRRLRSQLQGYVVKATIAATAACIPTVTLSYLPTTSRHHFATEIGRIRASTASSPPPLINDRVVDQTLSDLAPVTADEVIEILQKSPAKQCKLDPVPTWLVKRASHVLAPVIAAVCNASFQQLTMQHVYRATVVARLTYAASAWRGFTQASDRQRINSVIDRSRRLGYCSPDTPTFDELCDTTDDELFSKAVRLSKHVLYALLPPSSTASQRYNLRHRAHSLQLPQHSTQLSDSNFRTRMLYKNTC